MRILSLVLLIFISQTVFAMKGLELVPTEVQYKLQIDPEKTQKKLLCLLRKYHSVEDFEIRMEKARAYREAVRPIAKDWQNMSAEDYVPPRDSEPGGVIGLFKSLKHQATAQFKETLYNTVFLFHFIHSTPLIDQDTHQRSNRILLEQTLEKYIHFTKLYQIEAMHDHNGVEIIPARWSLEATQNITRDPSPIASIMYNKEGSLRAMGYNWESREFEPLKKSNEVFATPSFYADSFVEFLVSKNKEEVGLIELIENLLHFYNNDVLTTLGIIGYSFERERKSVCAFYRKALCFLNSRMTPLILPGEHIQSTSEFDNRNEQFDDPIGYNYHFWGYFNSGLQNLPGLDVGAYAYEIADRPWAPDYGDYIADIVGYRMGQYIHQNFSNQSISCPSN